MAHREWNEEGVLAAIGERVARNSCRKRWWRSLEWCGE